MTSCNKTILDQYPFDEARPGKTQKPSGDEVDHSAVLFEVLPGHQGTKEGKGVQRRILLERGSDALRPG